MVTTTNLPLNHLLAFRLAHSPFCQAVGGPPPLPTASSAPRGVTQSFSTKTPQCCLNFSTENQHGQNAPAVASSLPTTNPSAFSGTCEAIAATAPTPKMNMPTCALSAVARSITLYPGSAAPTHPPLEDFVSAAQLPYLSYTDFSSSVALRLPFAHSLPHHSSIFDHIPHPYNPDTFELLLSKHNLLANYPLLPSNLRYSFPLRHMPPLLQTVILPNNPSIMLHFNAIEDYLGKEVLSSRMSGPFSQEETELILHGPFQSSPLIVSVQTQQHSVPDKIQICQHLSKATKVHHSVNSHIHKEDFPTQFDMASKIADMVIPCSPILSPHLLPASVIPPFVFCAWGCLRIAATLWIWVFAHNVRYLDTCPSIIHQSTSGLHQHTLCSRPAC